MTYGELKRDIIPYSNTERKVTTEELLATRPVFSLDEAARGLAHPRGRSGTVERLKYHLETGRLKLATREVYAVVPRGVDAARFRPDPILVAAAVRPDCVFSHHSALELLGTAHSVWNQCTLYTGHRRRPLALDGTVVLFLEHPGPFRTAAEASFGARQVEHRTRLLTVTGPERTLVEGFRRLDLAGGLEEHVLSASGFGTLDLELLGEVLRRYDTGKLWAAVGWFLERFHRTFHVREEWLGELEARRPASPQYLVRGNRGGAFARRWNLVLPESTAAIGEPDER